MGAFLVTVVATLLLASACDGGTGPSGVPRLDGADSCANRDDAISDPTTAGEPLVGDVTGDGREDVVTIVVDPEADPGCRAFVWLEHAGEDREGSGEVLAVEQEGMEVGGPTNLPRPVALLELDDRPGAEIVLILVQGAATEFAAVYSYGGGSLARLAPEGGGSIGGLFPHGGGAGQQQASDCIGDGEIVASSAVRPAAGADRLLVTRTFFVRDGDQLLADLVRTEVHRNVAPRSLARFPEFSGGPFSSCAPA